METMFCKCDTCTKCPHSFGTPAYSEVFFYNLLYQFVKSVSLLQKKKAGGLMHSTLMDSNRTSMALKILISIATKTVSGLDLPSQRTRLSAITYLQKHERQYNGQSVCFVQGVMLTGSRMQLSIDVLDSASNTCWIRYNKVQFAHAHSVHGQLKDSCAARVQRAQVGTRNHLYGFRSVRSEATRLAFVVVGAFLAS